MTDTKKEYVWIAWRSDDHGYNPVFLGVFSTYDAAKKVYPPYNGYYYLKTEVQR